MGRSRQRTQGCTGEYGIRHDWYTIALPASMATINSQVRTSHVRTCWAKEEDSGTSEIFRSTELVEHVLSGPIDSPFGESLEEFFDHGGDDVTGGYCINSDTVLAPFRS